jgi:hypothetical protein
LGTQGEWGESVFSLCDEFTPGGRIPCVLTSGHTRGTARRPGAARTLEDEMRIRKVKDLLEALKVMDPEKSLQITVWDDELDDIREEAVQEIRESEHTVELITTHHGQGEI